MSDFAIRVENLGKRYRIGQTVGYKTLRESLSNAVTAPFRRLRSTDRRTPGENPPMTGDKQGYIWALKDVSFDVKQGEAVGIIGRNGSGKSTLLKILSRITAPTEGQVEIHGRAGALLEVGTGFHPELTGRENIYLNGAILGLKKAEIERKFDDIVAFAEIEKFLDTPVKRYSSGMYVRLAFAVAAHLEPDILLVDEVLAVGDTAFQKKCLGKMDEVAKGGRTVLFISHNMAAVKSLCSRCILLKDGGIELAGLTSEVTNKYMEALFGTPTSNVTFQEDPNLRIQFLKAKLITSTPGYNTEETTLRFEYLVREEVKSVLLCVEVRSPDDLCIFYSNDDLLNDNRKHKIGKHTITLTIPSYLLAPGEYLLAFGFWEPGHEPEHFPGVRLTFRREEPNSRLSSHGIHWPGLIYLPVTWRYIDEDCY